MVKYFIDEEDVGNLGIPLKGYKKGQRVFDSQEDAEIEANRMTKAYDICFSVWPIEYKRKLPNRKEQLYGNQLFDIKIFDSEHKYLA